jgi:hypothetical protein
MTNNEVIKLIEKVLFDLDTKDTENAKGTLKTVLGVLKCNSELNEFKKIVYDKMQFYNSRDKIKNKALYELYQELKKIKESDFSFVQYYTEYIEIIK